MVSMDRQGVFWLDRVIAVISNVAPGCESRSRSAVCTI
jgi:hypothetical protein